MTAVVSDSSPLNYLVWIECQHVLPVLYDRVLIPTAVFEELADPAAPERVRRFLSEPPDWMQVRAERELKGTTDPALHQLDPGERAAILLAETIGADLLLMDERAGVAIARQRGLVVTGTLGVLLQAARRGLVDIDAALGRLRLTSFRHTGKLLDEVARIARADKS